MLKIRRIEGREPGPTLLVIGGVHGDEFEPMAAIRRLGQGIDPEHLHGTLILVPIANEPAFARKHRLGEDGLDLARVCPGNPEGTPTERIAHELSALIRSSDFVIDLHTGGTSMSVHPLTGYLMVENEEIRKRQRRLASAFNLSIIWGTTAAVEGRPLSVARDAGIPAIYAEFHGACCCEPKGIEALERGCLNVMASLGMIEQSAEPPTSNAILIEDSTSRAERLLDQHASPCAGFFEPRFRMGQIVKQGAVLGTVSDVLGDEVVEIKAEVSGMVVRLRTVPSVQAGENLAVVLELKR